MIADIDAHARRRAAALADELARSGNLRDPVWKAAFARVPRHVFVPSFARSEPGPEGTHYTLVRGDDPAQRDEWLQTVYSDTALITQIMGKPVDEALPDGRGHGRWTSSSTAPGLMARMLEALDVREGQNVLEVGTGTGYNAALLCERLGSAQVTTVDIDRDLVRLARRRLAHLGYHPTVAAVDGRDGHVGRAPYDRIIATCAFANIPPAWIRQTRPGGTILTNLAGALGGAMLLARVDEDGTARGRFLPQWAGFMTARGSAPAPEPDYPETSRTRTTSLAPETLDDAAFAFAAQLHTVDARPYWATHEDGRELYGLKAPDGSWAEVYPPDEDGRRPVEQGGPRPLWDLVETAHAFWHGHGRPDWSAYGVTATATRQEVWFGSPDGPTWTLPMENPPGGRAAVP